MIVTRNDSLPAGEVTLVNGVAITSPARTAFDLGRRPGLLPAVIAVDSLARATGLTVDDVGPLIDARRGARGMKQLRRVYPGRRPRFWCATTGGAVLARIDMGWEEWYVGVEYDGAQHWTDPRIRADDIDRLTELERRGWRIIRVSGDLLRNRPDILVARIREALRAAGYAC